jgi:hypothetical protein
MRPHFQVSSSSRRGGSVARRPTAPDHEASSDQAHADQEKRDRREAGEGESAIPARDRDLPGGLSRSLRPLVGRGPLAAALLSQNALLPLCALNRVLPFSGAAAARDTRDGQTSTRPAQQEAAHQHHRNRDPRSHELTPSRRAPRRCLGAHHTQFDAVQLQRGGNGHLLSQARLHVQQVRIDRLSIKSVHHCPIRMRRSIRQ